MRRIMKCKEGRKKGTEKKGQALFSRSLDGCFVNHACFPISPERCLSPFSRLSVREARLKHSVQPAWKPRLTPHWDVGRFFFTPSQVQCAWGRDQLLLLCRFGITLLKIKHNVLFFLINDRTVEGSQHDAMSEYARLGKVK